MMVVCRLSQHSAKDHPHEFNGLATITPVSTLWVRFEVSTTEGVLEAWLKGRKATTLATYKAALKDFAAFLAVPTEAAAVDALVGCDHGTANWLALSYRANMAERGLSSATTNLRLAAIRSMVKVARQIGRISSALYIQRPKSEPYRDTRGPGLDGWRSMLAEARRRADRPAGKRDLALILLMHDRGLRRGECVALDLVDVDLEHGTIAIVGKGHTEVGPVTVPRQTVDAPGIGSRPAATTTGGCSSGWIAQPATGSSA
jgi:integrase